MRADGMKGFAGLPSRIVASRNLGWYLGSLLIITAFLWVYGPFLFSFRFGFVDSDSYTYYGIGQKLVAGQFDTELRTPLFPLLAYLVSTHAGVFFFIAVQCVVFLVVVLFVFHSLVTRFDRWLFIPALAFALLTVSSQLVMKYNLFLTPESLFGSCCLIYVGLLVRCHERLRDKDLMLLSLVSVVSFLIRNSGEIFLATNVALVLFRRDSWPWVARRLGIAVVPIAAAVLMICVNNYARGGFFETTVLSIGTRGYLTVPLWQPSPKFPEKINGLVESLSRQIDPSDLATLRDSDNPAEIMNIQGKYNNLLRPIYAISDYLYDENNGDLRRQIVAQTGFRTKRSLPLYVAGLISDQAAKLNPRLYYKLIAANIYYFCCRHFNRHNALPAGFLVDEIKYMARTERSLVDSDPAKAFNAPVSDVCVAACVLGKSDESWAENLSVSAVSQVERTAKRMRRVELRSWGYVALAVSVIAGIGLLASGFRDKMLYVVVVVASIYVPYLAGMGWTGVVYEARLMVPLIPINYFLSIIGGAILVYRVVSMLSRGTKLSGLERS